MEACSESVSVVTRNPHCAQVLLNENAGYQCRTNVPFVRSVSDGFPRTQYRRRTSEAKSVIHWGQRKLLISEIEFLTEHGALSPIVVYAGAAPGSHLHQLASFFPLHKFVCFDPAPFNVRLRENLITKQEMFTNDVALEFANQPILFISDIRAADHDFVDGAAFQAQVSLDMHQQQHWVSIMKPAASLLKFCLPYEAGATSYLSGSIRLPVWGPITTTETRLLVKGSDLSQKIYDHRTYEENMFFFNTTMRVALFEHDCEGEGLDHCYDCRAEVEILQQFIESEHYIAFADEQAASDKTHSQSSISARVASLSRAISRAIPGGRTLIDANPDARLRKNGMRQRQWVGNKPAYEPAVSSEWEQVTRRKQRGRRR